jgi:hypothetical protein
LSLTQLEFFVSENFEIAMKNCQEMWALYFSKTLKNPACAQLREIRRNQVISAHANFNRTSKILGSVRNENLFVDAVARGHFSGYIRLPKISAHPQLRFFCVVHRYRKINKDRRADSYESDEGADSDSKVLPHLSAVSRL